MNSPRRVFLATPGLQGLRSRVTMLMLYRPNNKRARAARRNKNNLRAADNFACNFGVVGKMPKKNCYDNEDAESECPQSIGELD